MIRSPLLAIVGYPKFVVPLFCLLLLACTPAPPEAVVSDFWAAALTGDKQTAAALAVPETFDRADFDTAYFHQLFTEARLGEVARANRQAHVRTFLNGHFQSIDFNTIVVLHPAGWRVDYAATASEMIAVLLDAAVTTSNAELYQDIHTLSGSIGDAIRDEWHDFDRQLNEDQNSR